MNKEIQKSSHRAFRADVFQHQYNEHITNVNGNFKERHSTLFLSSIAHGNVRQRAKLVRVTMSILFLTICLQI